MKLEIFDNHEKQSQAAADMIIGTINKNPAAVLCLATGDSPRRTYELVVEKVKTNQIDLSRCSFIGLDEWVGIAPSNTGSCDWFLHHYLFKPLNINSAQIFLFDAMAHDLDAECKKMNAIIGEKGIDCMLVGVGINGHIGFNEPGTPEDSLAHVIDLDATTLSVGTKYFSGSMETSKGITLGLKQFLQSATAIMMANGKKKSGIIKSTLENNVNTNIPSTLIRKHPNAVLMIDREAAADLNPEFIHENSGKEWN